MKIHYTPGDHPSIWAWENGNGGFAAKDVAVLTSDGPMVGAVGAVELVRMLERTLTGYPLGRVTSDTGEVRLGSVLACVAAFIKDGNAKTLTVEIER